MFFIVGIIFALPQGSMDDVVFCSVLLRIHAVSYMICFILRKRGPHHGKTKESTASF